MNVVTLGMRNAFRNRTRTSAIIAILGLSIGLSLIMLISYQAVQQKVQDTKKSIGNTITMKPAGNTGMIGANSSTLSADSVDKTDGVDHVTDVVSILTDRIATEGSQSPMGMSSESSAQTNLKSPVELQKSTDSNGMTTYKGGGLMLAGGIPENFSPPITVAGSSKPTNGNTIPGGSPITITDGEAINGSEDANKAMLSKAMADKNGLKVGDTFKAYDETLTVSAIFTTETENGNNAVIVSLPTQQRLSDRADQVSTAVATIDSLDNLASATKDLKSVLGTEADVTSALEEATKALQPLDSVKKVALFSLLGSVVAGAVVVFMMMVMIVRERRREIGILKAIGASNVRIVLQFMSEAVTLTLIAAVIGLIAGIIAGGPVTSSLVDSSVGGSGQPGMMRPSTINIDDLKAVQTHIGASVPLFGLGGALLIAMIGSAFAGWLIAKVRPAEVMRQD